MNLQQLGKKLSKLQQENERIFLGLFLIVILVFLPGTLLLVGNVEPSIEKILPSQVKEIEVMNDMRSQFGADMIYIVLETKGMETDIKDPSVIKYSDMLSEKLRTEEFILEVTGTADFVKQLNGGIIPESRDEINRLLKMHPQSDSFVNQDSSLSIIQVRSDTGASAEIIKQVVEAINYDILSLEQYNPGINTRLTGFNTIDKATFEVIIKDFSFITLFSFGFMVLFLLLYFKLNYKKVLVSVTVILSSVIITAGLTGYLGLTITVITMVSAAMVMALGISYGINTVHEYSLLRKNHNRNSSLYLLHEDLIRALLGSSLTTSAGFLALLFGVIPAMKNLGIVLAIGITTTLLISILFLPVILYKFDIK